MRKIVLLLFTLLPVVLLAQQVVEITEVNVQELDNELFRIEVSVRNISPKTISEISGLLDFLDRSGRRVDKAELNVLLQSDIPLKPGQIARRSLIISQRPDLSGSFRYRITNLRFFGELGNYLVCPNCGELILKD